MAKEKGTNQPFKKQVSKNLFVQSGTHYISTGATQYNG